MAVSIGPKIGVQGELQFRHALREVVAEGQKLGAQMDRLTAQFNKNDDAITRTSKEHHNLSQQIYSQNKAIEENTHLRDLAVQKYNDQVQAMARYEQSIDNAKVKQKELTQELSEQTAEQNRIRANLKVLQEEFGATHDYTLEAASAFEKATENVNNTKNSIDSLQEKIDEYPTKIEDMSSALHRDGVYVQQWETELVKAQNRLFELEQELAKAPNYVAEFSRNTEESARKLITSQSAIAQLDASFKNLEQGYSQQISILQRYTDKQDYLHQKLTEEEQILSENIKIRDASALAQEKQEQALQKLTADMEDAEATYGKNSIEARKYNEAVNEQQKLVFDASQNTAKYNLAITQSEGRIRALTEELARGNDYVAEFGRKTDESRYKFESIKNSVAQLDAELRKTEAGYTRSTSALQKYADSQSYLTQRLEQEKKAMAEANQVRSEASIAVTNQQTVYSLLSMRLEEARKQYGDTSKEAVALEKALEEQKNLVREAEKNLAKYNLEVTNSAAEIKKLEKELAKGANFVEEFNKATTGNVRTLDKYNRQMQILDSELKKTQSQYGWWTGAMQKHRDTVDHLTKALEKQKQIVAENQRVHEQAQQTLQKQRDEYDKLAKKLSEAERQYGKDSEQARILNDALEEQAKLVDEAEKQTDEYTKAVLDAQTAQRELQNEFDSNTGFQALGSMFEKAGEKMEKFGDMMTKYVSTPLMALSTYAVKAGADFEDAMAKIYTIAIDSTEPMEKMHDELIALSNDTGFDLSDLGEATYQAVSASVDAGKAVEFMGDATKLARAGFTSTTKAVDLLTTVINAYGMEVEDASKISDILLKTQNDGKTVIDELASSMGIIIPMASNYNVGLDQIAAAYATMTKQGVKTERATTFLRAVFTELEKESSDVADILMEKTGKSFAQLMGEGNDLSDVLKILYDYVGGNAEEFQRLFGNVRATQAVASLVADDFGMLDYELGRVRDSAGQVDKALEVMETPALKARKAVNRLKNSAEDLGETMIDMAMPAFEKVTSKITELTDGFIKLQPETKQFLVKAGAFAIALGPVTKGLGVLVKYVGGLLTGTAPLLPLVAGITALFIGMTTAIQAQNTERLAQIRNTYGLSDAMKEELAELDQMKTSHAEFQQSMQDQNTATMNQVAYIEELVTQYDALIGKDGQVIKGKETLAQTILGELASAMGMEVEDIEALIGENGKLKDSIQSTIDAYKQQAMASVLKDELAEASKRKVDAERIEKDITDQLAIASDNLTTAHRNREKAEEDLRIATETGSDKVQYYKQKLDDARTAETLAEQATKKLKDGLWQAKEEANKASNDIDYFSDRINNLEEESKKTADQIEKDAKRSKEAIQNSADEASTALSGAAKEAYNSGRNVAQGFADGINDYAYLSSSAASTMGANASKLLNHSVQVKSPSRVTMETGKYFAQGFGLGMEAGMPAVDKIAEQLGQSASNSLSFGSYLPENVGSVVNNTKTISAPISVNLTVNGNVDDSDTFARNIARNLQDLISRERGVFA